MNISVMTQLNHLNFNDAKKNDGTLVNNDYRKELFHELRKYKYLQLNHFIQIFNLNNKTIYLVLVMTKNVIDNNTQFSWKLFNSKEQYENFLIKQNISYNFTIDDIPLKQININNLEDLDSFIKLNITNLDLDCNDKTIIFESLKEIKLKLYQKLNVIEFRKIMKENKPQKYIDNSLIL